MLVSCKKCSVRVHASEYHPPPLILSQQHRKLPVCCKLLSPNGHPTLLLQRLLVSSWEVGSWWMSCLVASIPMPVNLRSPGLWVSREAGLALAEGTACVKAQKVRQLVQGSSRGPMESAT